MTNLLPYDGEVYYFPPLLSEESSDQYFHQLTSQLEWQPDTVKMFGKTIFTGRKVAWYGEKAYSYTYANDTKEALYWTDGLTELKSMIETISNETYNSCLLNYYHHGEEGMGWHRDNEKEMKKNAAIASFSLGAERKFVFKHRESKEKVELWLENGSLLVMKGTVQTHWLHSLPKSKKVKAPRINLTFRTVVTAGTQRTQRV